MSYVLILEILEAMFFASKNLKISSHCLPGGTPQDTGATFWNELEEETELYEGRETEIMGVTWQIN